MKKLGCEICYRSIPSIREGRIWISYVRIEARERELGAWREANPLTPMSTVTVDQIMQFPALIQWVWGHADCPDPDGDSLYWIEAARFNSVPKALDWTLHLMGKSWIQHTDWVALIRRLHSVPYA